MKTEIGKCTNVKIAKCKNLSPRWGGHLSNLTQKTFGIIVN